MYKNTLLIYNDKAGQIEIDRVMEEIIPILIKGIENLTLSKTKEAGDAERIARENGENYNLIISLGGDGTLHEIINGLSKLEHPPRIGILPAGTCNDFARSLKIPLTLREASNTIIKGKSKYIDIGRVNGRYFTNFIGLGLITEISENINPDTKKIMGRIGYYTSAIKTLGKKDDFKFTLKTENDAINSKAGMIAILNGFHIGTTRVPVDSIEIDDGLFNVFIVYEAGFPLLLKYLTQKENFEELLIQDEIQHLKASSIKLETEEEMPIDSDGEIYLNTPIELSLVAKKFEFIVG